MAPPSPAPCTSQAPRAEMPASPEHPGTLRPWPGSRAEKSDQTEPGLNPRASPAHSNHEKMFFLQESFQPQLQNHPAAPCITVSPLQLKHRGKPPARKLDVTFHLAVLSTDLCAGDLINKLRSLDPSQPGAGCLQFPASLGTKRPPSTAGLRLSRRSDPGAGGGFSCPHLSSQCFHGTTAPKDPFPSHHPAPRSALGALCYPLVSVFNSKMHLNIKKASHPPPPIGLTDCLLRCWSGDTLLERLNFPYPITSNIYVN